IRKMGGLKGLAAMFGGGKGGPDLGSAMEGMHGLPSGSMPGLPGMGGGAGGLPPDLARLLNKKK
ncbi:signal recognition particle protein, partial [Salmonella enterica subsp. enterica serovar Brandenburg]